MITIKDIRGYMTTWSKRTYAEGLEYCFFAKQNEKVYRLTAEVLQRQNLDKKYMDGYSVQKIPIKNEEKVDVIFTDIFWNLAKDYITPASYVAAIVKKCIEIKIENTQVIAGIVGRGLRAFPSFIREMDLTYKMLQHFPNAKIMNGPEQDVGEHTDLLIKNNEDEYRVWSYQNTQRGLINTARRFCGYRGKILKGYYILCPIDIGNPAEIDEVEGWFFYSERYVKYLFEMIMIEKPDDYNAIVNLREEAIYLYIKKANVVIKRG